MAQRKSTSTTTAGGTGRAVKKNGKSKTATTKAKPEAAKRTTSSEASVKTTRKKATQQIEIAPARDAVATRAYEIWLERGRPFGCDQDIWFEAEAQLARN
jgi:uncharacterized protein YaiL (DUF2058 family)